MDHWQRAESRMIRVVSLTLGVMLLLSGLDSMQGVAVADDSPCTWCGNHGGDPNPQGDQDNGAVVTDGVRFPNADEASAVGAAARANASCTNCEWTIAPACLTGGPGNDALCQNAVTACPDPQIMYRVYMRHAGEPWVLLGTTCLGPGDKPTSVADVGEIVRERVVNYLPDASPSFQPAEGGVVNLPTIFAAGEPATMETEPFDVLGFTVVVSATARWEWTFDDGVMRPFEQPGGVYPNDDVTYTYPDAGGREVSVTTYWDASFTVDGDGPFQVPGAEISKTAGPITVPVREAKPELVGG
jgi:hypothetical protein